MRKIEVKIRQLKWAFQRSFLPTTYDRVIFKGNEYYIKSSLTGENIWDLFQKEKSEPVYRRIRGGDLTLVNSFARFFSVFKQHLKFQKQNWGLIDNQNPVGTRLSYINSDNIYFRCSLKQQ